MYNACDLSTTDNQDLNSIQIYPNPITNDRLTIVIDSSNKISLDTEWIPFGMFFLKLVAKQGVFTRKKIK